MSDTALTAAVEAIAQGPHAGDASVRTQLACIRSLMDEMSRCSTHEGEASGLREQLFEEMTRLRSMLGRGGGRAPAAVQQ